MPFAFGGDVRSILQVSVVVDVPVADQLPEKHHLVGIIFGRTIGEKQLQIVGAHRRAAEENQRKNETNSHTTSLLPGRIVRSVRPDFLWFLALFSGDRA